jgi:hypothetical protein
LTHGAALACGYLEPTSLENQPIWGLRKVPSLVGTLLVATACLWSGLAAAESVPIPAAKPAAPPAADVPTTADHDAITALRGLAVGAGLTVDLNDLESAFRTASLLDPSLPEPPDARTRRHETGESLRRGGAAAPALGKLVGATFGGSDRPGSDWGLSVGVRRNTALRPGLPGAGPEEEMGLGAGVRVDLSERVTLGGGYGYFSDDWAGYFRDDHSTARPSSGDDLGTDRSHHVAGLRLTFELESSPASGELPIHESQRGRMPQ